ncbi:MAG TPA: 4Fe-4S dicluster domain-containing protein [Bacillota bacterium]|jgi:Fe-S oxidoreductase
MSVALAPSVSFLREVQGASGQPISLCYQCKKCSSGCPLGFAMDLLPHEVIRLIQLGAKEEVFKANSLWVCTCCKTCQARCPNEIDAGQVMDTLREMALRAGSGAPAPAPASPPAIAALSREVAAPKGPDTHVKAFHESFLYTLRLFGRSYELGMIALYVGKTRALVEHVGLGLNMVKKGKLKYIPERVRRIGEIRKIFAKAREKH